MGKKIVARMLPALLLIPTLLLALEIQPVRSAATWTVDDDGPADFSSIQEAINSPQVAEGDTVYVYDGTYYENAVVNKTVSLIGEDGKCVIDGLGKGHTVAIEADNVILTGFIIANSSLTHTPFEGPYSGLYVTSDNCSIDRNNVTNSYYGIWPYNSSNNILSENTIAYNYVGIRLDSSSHNSLTGNILASNDYGVWLMDSSNNSLSGNTITANNVYGLNLSRSSTNTICHNNFIDVGQQVYTHFSTSVWDDGYPSGGNYWSDHIAVDNNCGVSQDESGSDGIGDTPYEIDVNNTDHFPLMEPISFFDAGTWNDITYYVDTVSNSTVWDFQFNESEKLISFNVSGPGGRTGFCRVTIPKALLGGPYVVLVNDAPPITITEWTNGTHTFLYFTYNHSTETVEIIGTTAIPEFSSWISMLLLFVAFAVAIATFKRRLPKTPIH